MRKPYNGTEDNDRDIPGNGVGEGGSIPSGFSPSQYLSDMEKPGFLKMIRIGGLIAMIPPLLIGTIVAFRIQGNVDLTSFLLACIVGFSLHISMNVYNDIYDTEQGSDTLESSRSLFSGGSGALIENPGLKDKMLWISRFGILIAFLGTLGLLYLLETGLWPGMISVFGSMAFLSKFYTAEPIKLAYRSLGEITVWFGFGPLAILLATTAQGVGFDHLVLLTMPITGLSTLTFSWGGEMADMPYDREAGKIGLAIRIGIEKSVYVLAALHILIILNVYVISQITGTGHFMFVPLIPYVISVSIAFKTLLEDPSDRKNILKGTKINFIGFLIFSAGIIFSFAFLIL